MLNEESINPCLPGERDDGPLPGVRLVINRQPVLAGPGKREGKAVNIELFAPVKLAVGDAQGSPILLGGGSLLAVTFGIHEDLAGEDHVNLTGRGRIDVPLRFERPAQLLGDSVGLALLGLKRHSRPSGGLISSGVGDLPRFCLGDAEQVQNAYIGQAFFE